MSSWLMRLILRTNWEVTMAIHGRFGHAYGEGAQYVPLVLRAQELWYELEQESGESLFVQTGVLGIGSGNSRFIKETIKSAQIYSLPAEVLSSAEIRQRWPQIDVPDDFIGCFETTSGVLYNQNCIGLSKAG